MSFSQKLGAQQNETNSLLAVGLDSDFSKIPDRFKGSDTPIFDFNQWIIDQTHEYVCAYKPNSAFYEGQMSTGIDQLQMTVRYIQDRYPNIPVIIDAKRADIGSTNTGYVSYALAKDGLNGDALTLHPYLGKEALSPFLQLEDKGFFVLCRTSNPGAGELQDLVVKLEDGREMKLYQVIAEKVATEWNTNGNCMLVVGATYPAELAEIRAQVGDMTLLVPGIGTQGGDVEKTVLAGLNSEKKGIVINSSRDVIFNPKGEDPRDVARRLRAEINKYRES